MVALGWVVANEADLLVRGRSTTVDDGPSASGCYIGDRAVQSRLRTKCERALSDGQWTKSHQSHRPRTRAINRREVPLAFTIVAGFRPVIGP